MQTINNNEQTLDNTTDPPSLDIITTNINTSLPRVPDSQDNICLPRVADQTNNNNNTYKHLTRNPGKRRRTAKKKRLSRESFPRPNLERIDEETLNLSQPIPQKITEIATPSSEIITTITTPTTTPTHTPTPSPTSNTNNKSNVGEIGYKFKKFFPGHGYFQGEVIAIKSVCTDNKNRRCRYTDGDMDDMSLKELKKCPKATSTIYAPTRRSNRRTTKTSKNNSINITVEQMDEIQCTIKKLQDQKIKALTLQRAISEHEN